MAKIDQIIKDYLMAIDEDTGKFYCKVCNRLYKYESGCMNHIKKEHPIQLAEEIRKTQKAEDLLRLASYKKQIEKLFVEEEKRWIENQRSFIADLTKNGISYVLGWQTQGIVMAETKWALIRDINASYDHYKEISTGIAVYRDFLEFLKRFKDEKIKGLIERPYEHSSTSLMGNAVKEWANLATSEFISERFDGGQIGGLIFLTEYIIEIMEKYGVDKNEK